MLAKNNKIGCVNCSITRKKTLEDYKKIIERKEQYTEYILDYIPESADKKISGWKCLRIRNGKICGLIKNTSYDNIFNSKSGCTTCLGMEQKTLKDYYKINTNKNRNIECITEHLPKNNKDKVKWRCTKINKKTGIVCGNIWSARYNNIYGQNQGCPKCSTMGKYEEECRKIIEDETGLKFNKIKPKFLKGLELDRYNEEKNIAFEHNGKQHYSFVKLFHRSMEDFEKQKERDRRKIKLCKENNVKLIIIPYTISAKGFRPLEDYIQRELSRLDIMFYMYKENLTNYLKD